MIDLTSCIYRDVSEQEPVSLIKQESINITDTSPPQLSNNPTWYFVTAKPSTNFYCLICKKLFPSRKPFTRHNRYNHSKDRKHPCEICGKRFVYQYEAKNHENVHIPKIKRIFECNICNNSYRSKTTLKIHVQVDHYNVIRFSCKECGKNFKLLASLKDHQKKVHLGITLKCEDCGKVYRDASCFENHKKTHLPNYVREKFTCSVCQTQFLCMKTYKQHVTAHVTGPKAKYICDICGMSITSRDSLRTHLRSHTGEKPFNCDVCDKAFSAKRFLRTHLLVHTKEKPYSCDYCKQRFSQRSSLTTHLRRHTGERPYECNICNKCFISKTLLVSHMKTHKICPPPSKPLSDTISPLTNSKLLN
ncbi:hypothetical protein RI129_011408 [Pyrocoelia pectoralis]|uniref:C2H2-type domain-containing protein n=1 Tax=Pyrocoelia pectoralis TaxID=417401 RepID=A0AAN7ZFK2_9COLE